MTSSNFDTYAVFVPGECEGMTSGYDLVRVMALDPRDAIEKACASWFGTGAREGTYLVAEIDNLTAFDVDEQRVPRVKAQVGVPSGSAA